MILWPLLATQTTAVGRLRVFCAATKATPEGLEVLGVFPLALTSFAEGGHQCPLEAR